MKFNIINGEAISELKKIASNTIDLIVADPPYNLGKDYGNDTYNKEFEDYISFTKKWTYEAKRILKPKGTIYVFMGFKFISYIYQILERDQKLMFNNWICWH